MKRLVIVVAWLLLLVPALVLGAVAFRLLKHEGERLAGARTEAARPRPAGLGLAVGLAAIHALWALFQWTELLVSRSGGETFCGFADSHACAHVWDSGLASAVQAWTGLPVAAWGLVWSLAALALPLLALVRRAAGHAPEPFWAATLVTAAAGALSVSGLAAGLFFAGAVCATCLATIHACASVALLITSIDSGRPVACTQK